MLLRVKKNILSHFSQWILRQNWHHVKTGVVIKSDLTEASMALWTVTSAETPEAPLHVRLHKGLRDSQLDCAESLSLGTHPLCPEPPRPKPSAADEWCGQHGYWGAPRSQLRSKGISSAPCLLGESGRNQPVNRWLRKATGQRERLQAEILHFQPSKYFLFKWELSLEALSTHKCNVLNKLQKQQWCQNCSSPRLAFSGEYGPHVI